MSLIGGINDCETAVTTMRFASEADKDAWLADCKASAQDDTEITSSVEETGSDSSKKNSKLLLYVLVGAFAYWIYSQNKKI